MSIAVEEQSRTMKKPCPQCGSKLVKAGSRFVSSTTPRRKFETWACTNTDCSYKTEEVFDVRGRKLFQG